MICGPFTAPLAADLRFECMSAVPSAHIYHRRLDPHSQDSLAKLARWVRPGSYVLDLGAGPGVLGRYLTETLHCVVDGVEYNPAAIAEAVAWYRHIECADLEQIRLAERFEGCRYDFIVCADILEHLRQPGHLLAQLAELLAPQGRILLSVPNAAYAGLIADLLAGEFRYRPEGLLDATHLRFFTRASLLRLLAEHDLRSRALDATVMALEQSEFAALWMEGAWAAAQPVELIRALLDRPEALVYQFIVSAAPAADGEPTIEHLPPEVEAAAQSAWASRLAVPVRPTKFSLSVAIVTHAPDIPVLIQVLQRLKQALAHARQQGLLDAVHLVLLDNGPGTSWREPLQGLLGTPWEASAELVSGHGNVGYGGGHNLALQRCRGEVHLILNPDVLLEEDALSEGLAFLAQHPAVGLVAPAVSDGNGQAQYLCKNYPTVLDLALRGFAPAWLRRRFQPRLDRYELRHRADDAVLWDPPIASGCFMLCRRAALDRIGGFRPDYFLYFEDFDLSLRLAAVARLAWVPRVRILHLGGHAARKGFRHIALFSRAALLFFKRHGWRWW
ncbi:MAG: methyltransferase domain-containing protein [Candidatus Competibacteraceae bacterium]|nr:methyltransferase domain-containing protein [Candidatus Competibacteraceae bacterium]